MKEQALIKVLHGMVYAMQTIEQNIATINSNTGQYSYLIPSGLQTIKHNLDELAVPEPFNAYDENGSYKNIGYYPVKGFTGIGQAEWGETEFAQDAAGWGVLVARKPHLKDHWEVAPFSLVLHEKDVTLRYMFSNQAVTYSINGASYEEILPANALMYNHMIDRMRVLIGFDERAFKEKAAEEQREKLDILRGSLHKAVKELKARQVTGFIQNYGRLNWLTWLPELPQSEVGECPNSGAPGYSNENPTTLTFMRNSFFLKVDDKELSVFYKDPNKVFVEWSQLDLGDPNSYTLDHHRRVVDMVDVMLDSYCQVLHTVPSLETIEQAKSIVAPKCGWRAECNVPFNTKMYMGEGQPTIPLQRTVSVGATRSLTDEERDYVTNTLFGHSLPNEVKEPAKWNRSVEKFCDKTIGVLSKALDVELVVDTTVPFVLVREDEEDIETKWVMSKSIPAFAAYYAALTGMELEPTSEGSNQYRVKKEGSKVINQEVLSKLLDEAVNNRS